MWNEGWDKIFADNDWGQYPPEELVRFVMRNFKNVPDRSKIRILEVGCGTGANIWFIAREGFDTYGIDGSRNGISKCEERLAKEGLTSHLSIGDVMTLPYEDDFFDCVIDNECLYSNSYHDTEIILNEIHRVMKSGGKFYSRTFMTGTYGDGMGDKLEGEKNTYKKLTGGALRTDYGIIRFTEKAEIQPLYGKNFDIKEIGYTKRNHSNTDKEIGEWLILCEKP